MWTGTQTSAIRNCLVLKLLSAETLESDKTKESISSLPYRSGMIPELITGMESRIELQFHEFEMVSRLITALYEASSFAVTTTFIVYFKRLKRRWLHVLLIDLY